MELTMAVLIVSYQGYVTLNQTPYKSRESPKKKNAKQETIFVKNHLSFWMVVSLNCFSPDMDTKRPIMVRSPVVKTTPVQFPWVTNVEFKARLWVSSALLDVEARTPGIISPSPVRSDRSKRRSDEACTTLKSAGTQSPLLRATISPTTISAAGMSCCWPSLITYASSAISVLMDRMTLLAFQSTNA